MNFYDNFINGHAVRVRPGFFKQRITIDGKQVPRKFMKFNFPLVSIVKPEYDYGERRPILKSITFDRDKISVKDDKIFVNDHEIEL